MPILTTCPSCGRALRVPDNLIGADVRCPGCETIFQASGEPARPAEPPADLLGETKTHIPSEGVRELPPPADAPPPLPAETRIREEGTAQSIPLPPPPEFDHDEDDDEEEIERMEEVHRRRRRGMLREEARSRVNAPSIGLIIAGALSIVYALLNAGMQLAMMSGAFGGPGGGGAGGAGAANLISSSVGAVLGLVLGSLIVWGAIKMRRLESYGLALTACIIGIIPCHGCCLLGAIFGIWGIVILNDPDVKGSFMAGPQKKERPDVDREDEKPPQADLHVDEI
jgi:predicted Zn finger-like uncharacterized protein